MKGPVVVLGGSGLLGYALRAELTRRGIAHEAPTRADLDLMVDEAASRWIDAHHPGTILNAAGFTNVPACEFEDNRAAVDRLNEHLPAELARASARTNATLLHVSTDYVFDGAQGSPYEETDAVHPLQVYGTSKLEGERAVLDLRPQALVIRVSTLYGPGRPGRDAYVDAILRQARASESREEILAVVETPVSSPTYAPDVATAVLDLIDASATGLLHVVNDGGVSRLDLARAAIKAAGLDGHVNVIPKPEPMTGLARPAYSVLATDRLFERLGRRLPPWEDALRRYVSP